jgi:wyosine [tRNA(Phe)-imidazoG37] synthetase (radical SAM superfamily)
MNAPTQLVFGPVPSRRLGNSLGINHIPYKHCSYSCIYCQVGPTMHPQIQRRRFYAPQAIADAVQQMITRAKKASSPVDYLTFVADGEPTLDADLGEAIRALRPLGLPTAVITNASLLWREEVRSALSEADWVSIKIDAVRPRTWRRINRPHRDLNLQTVMGGARQFAAHFKGVLATETMLVSGINDEPHELEALAGFIQTVHPQRAYLAIPVRPPTMPWAQAPATSRINTAFQIFASQLPQVEYLIGYEGDAFANTGRVEDDLLSITAVHPMSASAVEAFLRRSGSDPCLVDRLVAEGRLVRTGYRGRVFYLRRCPVQE